MFDDLDEMVTCPHCHAEQAWEEVLLGVEPGGLKADKSASERIYYRCPRCGGRWYQTVEEQTWQR